MQVKFKKLHPDASVPQKAHPSDAGFDLVATSRVFDEYGCATYGTGIAVEIPKGYVGLVFPRSSICKQDIFLTNSVGVIDSGYRGEIMAKFKPDLLFCDTPEIGGVGKDENDYLGSRQEDIRTQYVTHHGRLHDETSFLPRVYGAGDRIAQLIIIPYPEIEFIEAATLSSSDRGTGGYGSTDK